MIASDAMGGSLPTDNICFRPKMAESTLNDSFWARSRLISRAGATGNLRARLPDAVTSSSATRGPKTVDQPNLARSEARWIYGVFGRLPFD